MIKKYKDLIQKGLCTIGLLLVYTFGQSIPIPGHIMNFQMNGVESVQNLLALMTGGVFSSPTLFSLGMGPYMTVSIILSIITFANPDNAAGLSKRQRGNIQVQSTFILATLQATLLAFGVKSSIAPAAKNISEFTLFLITVLTLITGAMLISWIASLNAIFGLGGPFIMIVPGLISGLTRSLLANYAVVVMHLERLLILILVTVLFVFIVSALYSAEYHLDVQRIGIDRRSKDAYIAFKILIAGTLPLMFANTFMYLPAYVMQLTNRRNDLVLSMFNMHYYRGIIVYGAIIYILGVLFSFVNIMPDQIAKSLQESNDYILNVEPGKATHRYITKRVLFFALTGSLLLAVVVTVPLLVGRWTGKVAYSNFSNYFAMLFVLIAIFETVREDVDFLFYKDNYNLFGKQRRRKQ
ncbi:preprotein translocase subunit SecY [Weissella oryzae SG25]|uniref:Preprotein translocase subunit SecY n=1 Tax=Weissella oryzae (strain DSM 25784 / JCM 18191 / LMG 30913 / SG25) TaxID=1329250 RepID=A0A069CVC0_WEIOS|nr:preprotein translocase subunit SecY [Weissella oryzae]GAK31178.1 preprotein translocase subunit SecY [Weissella oryzae SG25]